MAVKKPPFWTLKCPKTSNIRVKLLRNLQKSLLSENGYPEDYLEPIYECKDCKDTGYIGSQKCHCFQKAIVELLYTQSNLKEILQKENFDHFSFSYYSDNHIDAKTGTSSLANIKKAHAVAMNFVERFGKDFNNLFLYGDTGVGKTFLSNCIAKELIDRSYSVIYLSSFDLFDILANKDYDEISGEWGDTVYEPQGIAQIECDIVSALGAFDNPSLYTIENVKVIEGVDVPLTEVVSFTHTYAGEVIDGEHVVAKGKVEKVIVNGEFSNYRIVVGTTREAIDEYLKLKESPA